MHVPQTTHLSLIFVTDSLPKWSDPNRAEVEFAHSMHSIAALFTSAQRPPKWVHEVLAHFSWELGSSWSAAQLHQRREEVLQWAKSIELHSVELAKALENSWKYEYLTESGSEEREGNLLTTQSLYELARAAKQHRDRIAPDRSLKRGAGKARPNHWISPRQTCAVIVSEIWAHFYHMQYPPSGSRKAAAIAEALYKAINLEEAHFVEDPHSKWRNYFKNAKADELEPFAQKIRWLIATLESSD